MNKKQLAMLASYGRSFLAAMLTALMLSGEDMFNLNMDSFKKILAAGVAAILPVAIRAANPNDAAFGTAADEVSDAIVKKVAAPVKKKTVKKTAK